MYSQDGGLILKNGVVLTVAETVKILNKMNKVSSKWHQLRMEIGRAQEESKYDYEDDWEYDDEVNLAEIGELCLKAFGYL